jgi:probable blue pigment (indigoidine) exporter
MSEDPDPRQGRVGLAEAALLAVTSLAWGAAYVFIRVGLLDGATPLAFASTRYALSAALFLALAAARQDPRPNRRALLTSAGVGGVLFIGLYGGFLYWGEQYTTGGYAAVLASTVPVLTVAIGYPLLASERLGALGLGGIAIGFVGTALLVFPQLEGSPIGSWQGPLFIIAAMVSVTLGSVLLRRSGIGAQGLWQIASQFLVAAALLGAASFVLPERNALPFTQGVLATLAALVVFSSVLGYFAYFALHHRVGPVRANLVTYLSPIVGVTIGTGLFGEAITGWEIAGVAVVLAGVTLVLRDSSRRARIPAQGPRSSA